MAQLKMPGSIGKKITFMTIKKTKKTDTGTNIKFSNYLNPDTVIVFRADNSHTTLA